MDQVSHWNHELKLCYLWVLFIHDLHLNHRAYYNFLLFEQPIPHLLWLLQRPEGIKLSGVLQLSLLPVSFMPHANFGSNTPFTFTLWICTWPWLGWSSFINYLNSLITTYGPSQQASTHMHNKFLLAWGSLRLAPLKYPHVGFAISAW